MKDATFEDVVEASKQAKAFDFIIEGNFGLNEIKKKDDETSSTTTFK